jgi:hypothetical protein
MSGFGCLHAIETEARIAESIKPFENFFKQLKPLFFPRDFPQSQSRTPVSAEAELYHWLLAKGFSGNEVYAVHERSSTPPTGKVRAIGWPPRAEPRAIHGHGGIP